MLMSLGVHYVLLSRLDVIKAVSFTIAIGANNDKTPYGVNSNTKLTTELTTGLNSGVIPAESDLAVMCSWKRFTMYKLNTNTTYSANCDAWPSINIMQAYLSLSSYQSFNNNPTLLNNDTNGAPSVVNNTSSSATVEMKMILYELDANATTSAPCNNNEDEDNNLISNNDGTYNEAKPSVITMKTYDTM